MVASLDSSGRDTAALHIRLLVRDVGNDHFLVEGAERKLETFSLHSTRPSVTTALSKRMDSGETCRLHRLFQPATFLELSSRQTGLSPFNRRLWQVRIVNLWLAASINSRPFCYVDMGSIRSIHWASFGGGAAASQHMPNRA